MENAPMLSQEEMLAKLNRMSASANTGIKKTKAQPRLFINQEDHELKHPLGSFVIGVQRDDDGDIVNHGKRIDKVVILRKINGYSYYNSKNKKENCSSPLFDNYGDKVKGVNHLYTCGKTCPFRAEGRTPRCTGQIVLFCAAFTDENEIIPCVWYVKGTAYMPVNGFLNNPANFTYKDMTGNSKVLDSCLCYVNLATTEERNPSDKKKKFYVPALSRGGAVGMDENGSITDFNLIEEMYAGVNKANEAIEDFNNQQWDKINKKSGGKMPGSNARQVNSVLPKIEMNDDIDADSDIDGDLGAELLKGIEEN